MPRSRSIRRRAYYRRSKSGHKVYVPSTRIPDHGLPGRGPKILPLPERGVLSRHAYHDVKSLPEERRHQALKRAVKESGHRKTIGHLVLIANYTSRSDPAAFAIFKRDQEWLSNVYRDYKAKHGVEPSTSPATRRHKKSRHPSLSRSRSRSHAHSRSHSHARSRSHSRWGCGSTTWGDRKERRGSCSMGSRRRRRR